MSAAAGKPKAAVSSVASADGQHSDNFQEERASSSSGSRLKEFGPWTEQYSSAGKRYFYNRETEVSQWEKPIEWREYEKSLTAENHSPISSASGVRIAPSNNISGMHFTGSATSGTSGINNDEAKNKAKTREIAQTPVSVAPRVKRAKIEEDLIGPVVFSEEQHRRFLRADSQPTSRRWQTEDWEQSALKAEAAAHNLSLQIIYVSCDLKSARSLVKTAEMRSRLLAQKLQFIADHQRHLEATFTLPPLPSINNYQ